MAELLLLGIIPGTHFQITFDMWLHGLIVAVFITSCLYLIINKRPLLIMAIYFAAWQSRTFKQSQVTAHNL